MTKSLLSNSVKLFVFAALCITFGIGQAFAQSTVTGGIGGKVTDPQGAVIPNATITATNNGTNQETTATADSDGGFRLANLQPGTYTVKTSSSGFADFTQEKVIVEVGKVTTLNIPLGLAGQTATVQVTAETPVINTTDNSNTTNINQTSINELPINGRRASNFALLAPSTVPDGTFGLISFRGISGLLNNSTVDGGDNNQAFFSEERGRTRINYVISQSSVREFQINGSNYSAEYGRAAGGVINTVTKSGTNEFHGELFYYNRNNRNGARNPSAFGSVLVNGVSTTVAVKPVDLRQQFGGSIGGPIFKDRLFFFFDYDQQKRNFPGLAAFQNANYLNTVSRTTLLTRGLTNAQIDNSLSFLNSLTGETPRKGDQTIYLPKLDWHINDNNLFSATYNRMRWFSPAGVQTQAVNNYGRESFGNDGVKVDTLNLRLQSTISPNLLNEARFQYGRDFEYQSSQPPLPGEPLTGATALGPRSPNIFLNNGLQFGIPNFLERPAYPDERRIQFADTVTYTDGRHTFKFGGDFNRVSDNTQNLRYETGGYSYNNINDFIVDYANYVTPLPANTLCATSARFVGKCYTSNYSQGIGTHGLLFKTNDYDAFAQDDFRVTPRLTVNLGLRYEYIRVPKAVLPNSSTLIIPNINRTIADATSTLPSDKNNFGPRIGLAYDVFGDGKTSLRGGYGIYYGRIINSTIYNALINTGNPGGQAQLSISSSNVCAPVFPNILSAACSSFTLGAIQYFSKNFQAPLINQYDVVLEHEIAKNTVASISYIGSLGRNLPTFVDYNLLPCLPGTTFAANNCGTGSSGTLPVITSATFPIVGGPLDGQTITLPQYGRPANGFQQLTQIESTVSSEYDAFVAQVNRRFTNGLQFQASYTLARSTDTNQNSATFTQNNAPLNVFDRSYDAGPSNFDVRHKVVVSAVYAPNPYGGDKSSFYNYLLNGWSIAPIFAYYSGRPFDGTVSGVTLNGTNGDNRFPLNQRNAFRLPRLVNLDLRLSKRFRFTERYNLEVLAEGFNVFNRTQVFGENTSLYSRTTNCATINGTASNNPNSLCYNPVFGTVTTTGSTLYNERQLQFSARFQF
ncbi:MAG: TonB-dependent receptor domain-containing protein [Pyrinomonadaceae bacterium]